MSNKKSYNLTHNPYGKLKEGPEAITENPQHSYMENLEQENKALREFKKNWLELKTQLVFTIENYGEDDFADTEVAGQILKEMNKLEAGG